MGPDYIAEAIRYFKTSDQSNWDPRVKALIITKLEEAQLWETKLVK